MSFGFSWQKKRKLKIALPPINPSPHSEELPSPARTAQSTPFSFETKQTDNSAVPFIIQPQPAKKKRKAPP
jgi:hypothetical protein